MRESGGKLRNLQKLLFDIYLVQNVFFRFLSVKQTFNYYLQVNYMITMNIIIDQSSLWTQGVTYLIFHGAINVFT